MIKAIEFMINKENILDINIDLKIYLIKQKIMMIYKYY